MKAPRLRFALLVLGIAIPVITGCSTVTVKKPAGDKVAKLDPAVWEGTWRGADNFRGASTIKDPAKGLVEFRSLAPDEKKDTVTLTIRELKDKLVATVTGKQGEESTAFFRIAATEDHITAFLPRLEFFKEAVASGKVAGEIRKTGANPDKDRKPAAPDSVVLNQFGAAEVDQISLPNKGSAVECFESDPGMVLVREKKPAKTNGEKKQPGNKK
jgi:hypothetical protein